MKKINCRITALALMALPLLSHAQEEKPFQIDGALTNPSKNPVRILLYYPYRSENVLDSADVIGGKYHFEGEIDGPLRAELYARYSDGTTAKEDKSQQTPDILTLFIEPSKITINSTGAFSNAVVSGSKSNEDFIKLQNEAKTYENQLLPLMKQYEQLQKNKDRNGMAKLRAQADNIQQQMVSNVYGNYVKTTPDGPLALFALQQYTGPLVKNIAEAESLYQKLPVSAKESSDGKKFQELIRFSKMTLPGKIAPDFIQSDTIGNSISLSSYRGKYVLLQFWAGFAVSSRAENKRLIPVYNKYAAKGFDILGVSLDKGTADGTGKETWINALRKDKLPWAQVSDLMFWNNAAAKKYGVSVLPENFLIDPNGKIIARFLNAKELDEKLATIFKQ